MGAPQVAHHLAKWPTQAFRISWAALHAQFGPDVADNRTFQRGFTKAMRQALAVYPSARMEPEDGGLRLQKSVTAIQRKGIADETVDLSCGDGGVQCAESCARKTTKQIKRNRAAFGDQWNGRHTRYAN